MQHHVIIGTVTSDNISINPEIKGQEQKYYLSLLVAAQRAGKLGYLIKDGTDVAFIQTKEIA